MKNMSALHGALERENPTDRLGDVFGSPQLEALSCTVVVDAVG